MTSEEYGFSISVVAFEDIKNVHSVFGRAFDSNMTLTKDCPRSSYLFKIKGDQFSYAVISPCMDETVKTLSGMIKSKVSYFQYENHANAYRNTIYLNGKIIDDWIFDDGKYNKKDFKTIVKVPKGSMVARYNGDVPITPADMVNVDYVMNSIYKYHGLVVPSLKKFPGNDKKVKYDYIYSVTPSDGINPKAKQFMDMVNGMPEGPGKEHFKKMLDTMLKLRK